MSIVVSLKVLAIKLQTIKSQFSMRNASFAHKFGQYASKIWKH
jgi:hypothetical protein